MRKYPKIYSFDKDECLGILNGTVYIEEKVDGSQTSVWLEDGELKMGSRNYEVTNDSFRGFTEYIRTFNDGIFMRFLSENPSYILYGEWLVPHSIHYPKEMYHQFYLYDIFDTSTSKILSEWIPPLGVIRAPLLATIINPTIGQIKQYVGKSNLGAKQGEGVVIKNYDFINKFGDNCHAKMVIENFKEVSKAKITHADGTFEAHCCNLYVTQARIRKIMHKIECGDMHPMAYQARILASIYHDILTEEITNIAKKCSRPFDFRLFEKMVKESSFPIFTALKG
jgi:hypothetical protein